MTIARAAMSVCYPSRMMLAAAMNPCPCGYFGDPRRDCSCGPLVIARYLSRVSGPLLDRIDIHIDVPAVPHRELSCDRSGDPSEAIRARVAVARQRQLERFTDRRGVFANAHMAPRDLASDCRISQAADALLKSAIARLNLSARAYHRVLKISRTIADLADSATIDAQHVSEAVQYRTLDRRGRGVCLAVGGGVDGLSLVPEPHGGAPLTCVISGLSVYAGSGAYGGKARSASLTVSHYLITTVNTLYLSAVARDSNAETSEGGSHETRPIRTTTPGPEPIPVALPCRLQYRGQVLRRSPNCPIN